MITFKELRDTPRSQAIDFKYSKGVIDRAIKWFPEEKDTIIKFDKEKREKRLFGTQTPIKKDGSIAMEILYQNGVIKMYTLQKKEGNVYDKITVMNKLVNFKNSKKEVNDDN